MCGGFVKKSSIVEIMMQTCSLETWLSDWTHKNGVFKFEILIKLPLNDFQNV